MALYLFWHRGIMGSMHFKGTTNQLRFDKYYVWTPEMVKMMEKAGLLYIQKMKCFLWMVKKLKTNEIKKIIKLEKNIFFILMNGYVIMN